ncbi:MAG: RNase adapter RapZ [Clostridiales bacterium]|nr:RNase adapter RapZ [Clostridiales bacterium]
MEVIIVTGLSGAGKSQAAHCLEDLGYYCIDNMPPALIKNFIELSLQDRMQIEKAAFVVDARGGDFFDDLQDTLQDLRNAGLPFKILFLEASDTVLIRRYQATRRQHPLAGNGSVSDGILRERYTLEELRNAADYILDTSNMKAAQLNEAICKLLVEENGQERFTITLKSFGFKAGIPLDADMVFDVRFIPNPFYLASMRDLTGRSQKVKNYVMRFAETQDFIRRVHRLILDLIPCYMREGKSHLVVAIGCTGGQHRSVAVTEEFKRLFSEDGRRVIMIHRDL